MIIALVVQVADSLSIKIPSFTDRLNFTIPLIAILVIIMLFLLLKTYTSNSTSEKE